MARVLSAFIFIYLTMFVVNTFIPTAAGRYVMLFALAGVHVLAFGRMRKASGYISACLTLLGAALMVHGGATAEDWVRAWLNNAPVICLLLTVSLFTIPLYFEPYHEVLYRSLPGFARTPFQFYAITLGFTAALASLLNVASLPFVYNLLREAAAKYRDGVVAKCLIRATAVNMFWSPAFISVAIVMQYTGVSWFEILPGGVLLAAAAFAAALGFGAAEFRGGRVESTGGVARGFGGILGKLFLQLAILIVFIALLQVLTGKSALVTVPLVSFTGPLLLALVFSKLDVYRTRVREYFSTVLPKGYSEVILFTSFGFFGYALGLSEIKSYIPLVVQYLGFDSPLTLIPLITFLTTFPCLFGIHPLITISTIAITLPPGSIALTKLQMAGALLLGYMAYGSLSPFSAVNLVIFGLTKADPIAASIRQNWPYTVAVVLAATVILTYVPL